MHNKTVKKQITSTSSHLEYLYFFIAAISLALIIWQYYGMNRVLDIFPNPDALVSVGGDSINGGRSESRLIETDQGAKLHCETKPSGAWPFCNLEVGIGDGYHNGINLGQFDHLLLSLEHQSSAQDTVLVYLINGEVQLGSKGEPLSYTNKSNMKTILPTSESALYRLPLSAFFVPSWWILQNNATGSAAEPKLDNVTSLSIATGDSNITRSVDILLKKVQLTGKWITAQMLYLLLLLTWITSITVHGLFRVYQLAEQLKLNRIENAKLEEINNFLSIQKDEFEALAKTDPLTGLYNRAGTRELLQTIQNESDCDYSLIMFDIDHFKQVNDTYGHEVGDEILCSLSKQISADTRKSDHIARWGGEEFIILCPETKQHDAVFVADILRKKIADTPLTADLSITCSFGVAQYDPSCKNSIQSMFEAADAAMYRAKKAGRNRVKMGQTA